MVSSYNKYIFAFLLTLLGGCGLYANKTYLVTDSTTVAAIQRINAIKLDPEHYLSEECTADDWQSAYETAKILLKDKIKRWLTAQEISDVVSYIAKSDEKFLQIKDQSGDMYRAFVYVKKDDILVFNEGRQILIDTVVKEDSKQEPNNEGDSDKKEPAAVTSKPDEKVSSLEPEKEVAQIDSSSKENKQEESHSEMVTNKNEQMSSSSTASSTASSIAVPSTNADALTVEMLKVVDYEGVKTFIQMKEKKGFLTRQDYGQYATHPSVGTYYMFIYNPQYKVTGYIKVVNGKLTNLKTSQPDNLQNYKGCTAFWFRMLK